MFDYIIRCLRISFNSLYNWRSSGCNSMSTAGKIIGDCKWEMQRSLSRNIERNFYNIATSTMGESHYRLDLSTLLFVSFRCTKYDIPLYIYERANNNCLSGSDYNLFYRQDQVLKLWECFQPKNGWYKLHWARIGSSIVVFEKKGMRSARSVRNDCTKIIFITMTS